jgi:hypothetical protein
MYHKQCQSITATAIAAHLASRITITVPLIDREPTTSTAGLAINIDSQSTSQRTVAVAWRPCSTAFGIVGVADTYGHNGEHVWMYFNQAAAPAPLHHCMAAMMTTAPIAGETSPMRQALRLPLGVQRWTARRQRVLPEGQTIDLGAGPATLDAALQTLTALPCNVEPRSPADVRDLPPSVVEGDVR